MPIACVQITYGCKYIQKIFDTFQLKILILEKRLHANFLYMQKKKILSIKFWEQVNSAATPSQTFMKKNKIYN